MSEKIGTIFALQAPEPIGPYLNPNYWNGHALGDGDAKPIGETEVPTLSEARAAIGTAHSHMHRGGDLLALDTFRTGDVIAPADHAPGTIFVLGSEALIGYQEAEDTTDWSGQAVPIMSDVMAQDERRDPAMQYTVGPQLAVVTKPRFHEQ